MAILKDTTIVGSLTVGGGLVADFIVERGTNSNGWYTKWKSGWIEQGNTVGTSNNADVTHTYPIPFKSKVWSLTTTYLTSGARDNPMFVYASDTNLSLTSFKSRNQAGSGFTGVSWYACGY